MGEVPEGAGEKDVSKSTALPDTPVEIRLPSIRLKLEDLAFLRAIAAPNGTKCYSSGSQQRLLFLGLAEMKEVEPSSAVKEKTEKEIAIKVLDATRAIKAREWDQARNIAYQADQMERSLRKQERCVPTKAGMDLLRKGEAMSQLAKEGCAPRGIK